MAIYCYLTKYASPDIQNELNALFRKEILQQINDACKNAMCFAILVDECTDKETNVFVPEVFGQR
jgi:hypothetical protein